MEAMNMISEQSSMDATCLLQSFLTHPDVGVFSCSSTGKLLNVNKKFAEFLGVDEHSLDGRDLNEILIDSPPVIASLSGPQHESCVKRKDGSVIWLSLTLFPIRDYEGMVREYVGITQDITDKKVMEQELIKTQNILDSVFDTTKSHIAYLDKDFNFIQVNQRYADAGKHPREYYIGKNHFDLYPNSENEEIFRQAVKSGQSVSFTAKPFVYKEFPKLGVTYWDWDLIPVSDNLGNIIGLILSLVDVTERKRVEDELRRMNETLEKRIYERTLELEKEINERKKTEKALRLNQQRYKRLAQIYLSAKDKAEKANNAKSEYLANMSHELRTPLNVILSAIQLLERYMKSDPDPVRAKHSNHLWSMKQNCFSLLRLINNLIDTTKINSNFYELNMGNYNIVNVVKTITLSVIDYVQNKNIKLDFSSNVESMMMACDLNVLERILLNLLSNAIKFTEPGGTIDVSLVCGEDKVQISVRDTGLGIPEDQLLTIFERYKQVDKVLARKQLGSGIGLSLVKSFTEALGGNISVKSQVGKGSEFIVELPLKIIPDMDCIDDNMYANDRNSMIQKISIELSDIYLL